MGKNRWFKTRVGQKVIVFKKKYKADSNGHISFTVSEQGPERKQRGDCEIPAIKRQLY